MQLVKDKKYTQKELSILLDEPQPRISELLSGKISKLSLEKLVEADGNGAGASAATLETLAGLIASKEIELPIARTYSLAEVVTAYTQLAKGHIRGKIVLIP